MTGTSPVTLELQVPAGPLPAGRPAAVGVRVSNAGAADILFPGVLDGSETGTRYPHFRPAILRDGTVVAAPPRAEDPLVGPLRPEHLRPLAPGASFDPTAIPGGLPLATFATFVPPAPGRYELRLDVSTDAPDPEAWLGRFGQAPDVLELLARVPRVTLRAVVVVEWR